MAILWRIEDHYLYDDSMDVSLLDEDDSSMFRILFLQRHENGTSSFILMQFFSRLKIYNNKTLKLSAVLLGPAGTVYRLLGNQGSRHEKQKYFDCYKS